MLLAAVLCGCGGVREGEVWGNVQAVDADNGLVRLELLGGWFSTPTVEASIDSGDAQWLEEGREVRGELIRNDFGYEFKSVWPVTPEDESLLWQKNQVLRRDTVDRGPQAFREVGETVPQFALYDQNGGLFTRDMLEGRWTVMHFIFTRCAMPEMCPASTRKMSHLLEAVQKAGTKDALLISFTMDPEFDTPGVLKSYARGYGMDDPQSRFLTGPLQAVQDLKKQLGILSKPDEALVLKHTMGTVLVSPDLKIVHHVPHRTWSVEDFLEKIQSLSKIDPS